MKEYSLSKSEKLKSKITITDLFAKGKSVIVYPLKVVYNLAPVTADDTAPAKMAVTVPKRQYKKATQRNHIKRHVRESYRLAKPMLYQSLESTTDQLNIIYIYVGKTMEDTSLLPKAMKKLNRKLAKELGVESTPAKKD